MNISCDNNVFLKTVKVDDAQFILDLRTDSELNKYISATDNNLEKQIEFIKSYKQKEDQKIEYYFIIYYNSQKVGTVRVYNIDYEKSIFTWGSWIVQKNNPGLVALSSAYLSYYFGFNYLNLSKALIDVRKDNQRVFEFYSLYCDLIYEDDINYYLELKKENLYKFADKFGERISLNVVVF